MTFRHFINAFYSFIAPFFFICYSFFMYAEIVFPLPLRKVLTYSVPESFNCTPGMRVLCPLGRRNEVGFVVNIKEKNESFSGRIKNIVDLLDSEPILSEKMLSLTKWAADYYFVGWGEMIKAALPAAVHLKCVSKICYLKEPAGKSDKNKTALIDFIRDKGSISSEKAGKELGIKNINQLAYAMEKEGLLKVEYGVMGKTKAKFKLSYTLNDAENTDFDGLVSRSEQQKKVLAFMRTRSGSIFASEISGIVPSPHSVLKSMEKKGVISSKRIKIRRNPMWNKQLDPPLPVKLTEEQHKIVSDLSSILSESRKFHPVLIRGVTGSGKTEVYIRLIIKALELGMTAMYLVPEISLTPQTLGRLSAYMYKDIAVLHSGLSDGERADEWERIRKGRARLVVGTRSAIFAPLNNIGIIVVDEEHDSSFKQNEIPFYNARDLAMVRGREDNAVVLLGSATPSLESYNNAINKKYHLYNLTKRVEDRSMPLIEIVDLAKEYKETKKKSPFSRKLESELFKVVEKNEQAIILLNRRGYASFSICRSCGFVDECNNCSVGLTYHKSLDRLKCHYCGYMKQREVQCPKCNDAITVMDGWGTQQIEEHIASLYPSVKILRMDRDTVNTKDAYHELLTAFGKREAQILVGTQMVAKGHDFPGVTLVGIVSADTGLSFPDFRSAEYTYQLISQVSGRSGRGEKPGTVVVQTFYSDHYSIQSACTNNYDSFFNLEMKYRKMLKYPPFTSLAAITIRDKSATKARSRAYELKRMLNKNQSPDVRIIGPSEAMIYRKNNIYRYMILVKALGRAKLKNKLKELNGYLADPATIRVDIDPLSLF